MSSSSVHLSFALNNNSNLPTHTHTPVASLASALCCSVEKQTDRQTDRAKHVTHTDRLWCPITQLLQHNWTLTDRSSTASGNSWTGKYEMTSGLTLRSIRARPYTQTFCTAYQCKHHSHTALAISAKSKCVAGETSKCWLSVTQSPPCACCSTLCKTLLQYMYVQHTSYFTTLIHIYFYLKFSTDI